MAQTHASPPLPSSLASVARGTPTPSPQLAEGPAPCFSPGRPWLYGPCHQERSGHREPPQPGHTPVSVSLCHPTATPRGARGHPLLCFGHVLPRPDPPPRAAEAQLMLGSDPSRLSPGPSTRKAVPVGLGSHVHPLPLPPPAWPSWGSTAETRGRAWGWALLERGLTPLCCVPCRGGGGCRGGRLREPEHHGVHLHRPLPPQRLL